VHQFIKLTQENASKWNTIITTKEIEKVVKGQIVKKKKKKKKRRKGGGLFFCFPRSGMAQQLVLTNRSDRGSDNTGL
jgi:hypothetical protein